MRRIAHVLSAGLLLVAACGGSDSSITGSNNNGGGTGAMSATLDGKSWVPLSANVAINNNSILSFAGTEAGTLTTISIGTRVAGPGTYSLAPSSSNFGVGLIVQNGASWSTTNQGGAGTLVITTLTANHITATFSFDAPSLTSGGATRHVTNGRIDTNF